MKTLQWVALLCVAAGGTWPGRALKNIVNVNITLPPVTAEYIYVTNRTGGSNGVSVFKQDPTPSNPPLLVTTINDTSFNQPYDIVACASRRRLYVSNGGAAGTITVINGDSLSVETTWTIPNSQNLRGISVSPDQKSIFVAGQTTSFGTPANSPAVWEVDLATGTSSIAGSVVDAGQAAVDCAVIKTGGASGTTNVPGKLYFSVPNSSPAGYIGIVDIAGGGTFTSISTKAGGLAGVDVPAEMDRAPDHSAVYVCCGNAGSSNAFLHMIRIDTSNDSAADIQLQNNVMNFSYTSLDVSFRPETSPIRAYFLGNNSGTLDFYLYDDSTGVAGGINTPTVVAPNPPPAAGTVVHHLDGAGNDFFYFGDSSGTDNHVGRVDVKTWAGTQLGAGVSGATGPTKFAFMTQPPPPYPVEVTPKYGDVTASVPIVLTGAGFVQGCTLQIPGVSGPMTIIPTFIDSGTLQATFPPGINFGSYSTINITVINPDGQQTDLAESFTTCLPTQTLTYDLVLPSLSQGYQMCSVPLFTTVGSLRKALETALGPYDPAFYRIFFWQTGGYVELDKMADTEDLTGRGFWALTRFGATVTLTDLDSWVNANFGDQVIPLQPGWNMISMPFYQTNFSPPPTLLVVDWPATIAMWVSPDGTLGTRSACDGTPSILNPILYDFVGGAYVSTTALQTGHGYWVQNVSSLPAYLTYQSDSMTTSKAGGGQPGFTSLAAGAVQPPLPPGAIGSASSNSKSGCGLLGPELLLLALGSFAFHRLRRPRTLRA